MQEAQEILLKVIESLKDLDDEKRVRVLLAVAAYFGITEDMKE